MLVVVMALLSSRASWAEDTRIAVLYPRSTGGYEQVFNNMVQGIELNETVSVLTKQLDNDSNVSEINDWLVSKNIQSVITLGSSSYEIRQQLPAGLPVIVGAMVISPDGYNGISLAGDPVLFLNRLREMAPDVKRVFTVYSEENSGWLVDIAREEAKIRDIDLQAFAAENLKQGLDLYEKVLKRASGRADAIWIPLDSIVPDKAILPKILKLAWDKKVVVFSNNPLHVKKGVLFALYPDHKLMGQNLGKMAVEVIGSTSPDRLLPARQLKIAVNKRTASHLGLHYSKSQQRDFSIVFPSE